MAEPHGPSDHRTAQRHQSPVTRSAHGSAVIRASVIVLALALNQTARAADAIPPAQAQGAPTQPAPVATPTAPPPTPAPSPAATPAASPAAQTKAAEPTKAEAKAEAKAQETAGTPAIVLDGPEVESILGKDVQNTKGDDMGRIVDLLIDRSGQMRAAVIDFGGFFGVGSRKIAVDWRAIHMADDGKTDKLVIDLPRNQLRVAPVYKEGEPVVVLGRPPALEAPAVAPVAAAAPVTATNPVAAAAPAAIAPPPVATAPITATPAASTPAAAVPAATTPAAQAPASPPQPAASAPAPAPTVPSTPAPAAAQPSALQPTPAPAAP